MCPKIDTNLFHVSMFLKMFQDFGTPNWFWLRDFGDIPYYWSHFGDSLKSHFCTLRCHETWLAAVYHSLSIIFSDKQHIWLSIIFSDDVFFGYPSFFPDFSRKKQDILTVPWQPLGDFRAKLTPEVLPAAKSHFIAEELQPRAAEVQKKTWKKQMKKTIGSWKDMERTIFFCHKATCFLDELWSTVLLYYCTTTIFIYRLFAIYLVWRRASTWIRPQYLFATLPTDQSFTEFQGSGSQ